MKQVRPSRFCSVFLSFILLISSFPLAAIAESIEIQDQAETLCVEEAPYIYLNNKLHNITEFIIALSTLDKDIESPIHTLKKYISDGFIIGLQGEILQVLGYAEWLLEQEYITINDIKRNQLILSLDNLIQAITEGILNVDFQDLDQNRRLPLWVINKRIKVKGKAKFDSETIFYGKTRNHRPARFYKRAHFKDNVIIDGTASIEDALIENLTVENLTLAGGLVITDLTLNSLSATDIVTDNLQVNNCIPSLCVENLSVVDGSVSGTLSINDAVIQTLDLTGGLVITDLTLSSLSVTDAVVDNLQVNNCIPSLCVEDLSVVDGSVSGTLSINDAVIQTLDLTGGLVITDLTLNSLSATDAVIADLTVTNCVSELCVANLSVVDGSVSGTFSVNDAIIGDATVTLLSATDAVVTDLTVTNCISDLCVENLSVVDGAISGTLSINDAVIQTLDVPGGLVISDLTLNSLSAADIVVDNLQVNNCIPEICALEGSIIDLAVTGTLSVVDAVIQHLDIAQNSIHFQDSSGGEYVGMSAPTVVPASYSVLLPPNAPTANQVLSANALIPTDLEWVAQSGTVLPAASETIYVAKYGDDTTGDGSFAAPYASLSKAIDVANGLASSFNPVSIIMGTGIYIENNSAGPLTITAEGISIIGPSPTAVIILPTTASNDLLLINQTVVIARLSLVSSGVSTASAISLTQGAFSEFISVRVIGFQVGITCVGGSTSNYQFDGCLFIDNGTGLLTSGTIVECYNCTFIGSSSLTTAANTGVTATGANAVAIIDGGACGICTTGFDINNSARLTANAINFEFNTFDIIQTTGAQMALSGCNFEFATSPGDIDIQISGAGTFAQLSGCSFNGANTLGSFGTAIFVSNDALADITGGGISNYMIGVTAGSPSDASSTNISLSSLSIRNCTTDINQQGSASLNVNAASASGSKIFINDPTNVSMAFFDLDNNSSLSIGSTADVNTPLIQIEIDPIQPIGINYVASLYSAQAVGVNNPLNNPTTLYVVSNSDAEVAAITTDRTDTAGVRLMSDAGVPVGGTSALRGWDIQKNGSTAELIFQYQNNDPILLGSALPYTVMQLDGENNKVQFPTVGTQIEFVGDTNLYRSSANVLKTDDNFIVGTLTPGRVVVTDGVANQLSSSITTATEVSFLSGVTSLIQPQLDNKVSRSGDTMTGTLQLPAGTTSAPSLTFTGSSTTGLSADSGDLSFSTNGLERMEISSGGTISIDAFTLAGVVHNNALGDLSTSLIVNSDIDPAAAIVDSKLATISTAGKVANSATSATSSNTPNSIVARDSLGNFSANTITASLNGNAATATNFSGSLLGDVTGTQSATVVSFVGGQAASDVAAATVLANAATSSNTANAIVRRNASGNFSASTITANLTGSASNNVLKAGDTMTGTLVMSAQNQIDFQDAAGGEFVGINAPAIVPTSYTISLPPTVPTAHQVMRTNFTTPTDLEWFTPGGVVLPTDSRTIYVAKYGNDATGDGSFSAPYASLSKGIDVANSLATANDPISIVMGSGVYAEDNSAGPLTITAEGVSIIGPSPTAVIIAPTTLSNDFLLINQSVVIARIGFVAGGISTATGISLTNGSLSEFINIRVVGFQTGVMCAGGIFSNYAFDNSFFIANGTGLVVSDTVAECYNCTIIGSASLLILSPNTGINVTGSSAVAIIDGGVCGYCQTGLNINNGATITVSIVDFEFNAFDIVQTTGSLMTLTGSNFQYTTDPGDIDIQISGAGTTAQISGCKFNGNNGLGVPQATALMVSDNANVNINGGSVSNYTTGMQIGLSTDTASTRLTASSFAIQNCTTDIQQEGSATLNFNAGTADLTKIILNDSTNVSLAFFDLSDNNALTIGSGADMDTTLLQAAIDPSGSNVQFDYKSSLYSAQAMGVDTEFNNPTSLYVIANNDADLVAVTTNRTDTAGIRLVSDTGSPVGGTTALRGWDVNKNGSSGELSFSYQNSDVVGQSVIPQYTVMQLDGVNNQLQLPTTDTQIVFGGDTNLYRDSANVLKTDDNVIVGTLTPGRVVITDPITNELASSVVTDVELSSLSGVIASIQTQLNGKVAKAGDTMTGTLQLPAGTAALPSLVFTGSTTTGLSAPTANSLSFSNAGSQSMAISSAGVVSIDGFAGAAGVVHNDSSGNLSSSLIVNADITNATISNAKLATISSGDTPGAIVVRDGSGNFTTNKITIDGAITNPTDAATKAYVDSATSTGLIVKTPALVASTTNVVLNGLQTIDGVLLVANDRVLLVGQTNPVENGLWLAQAGAWTRPADFASGTQAGEAYVLVTSGATYEGASWVCSTPTAIIDTDPLVFEQFSLPDTTTGANIGAGTGFVFKNKMGVTLNFRSLLAGSHLAITTNSDDISFITDATNTNTASTIVARDASGNFSAGTITANLTGSASNNVLKAGDTMTGALTLPVGTTLAPSLNFTGSTTTGLSAATVDTLSFSTAAAERMKISPTGVVSINNLTPTAGIVHNSVLGNLSSSLIVNADVDPAAAIVDTKLATISTAGKVANSATSATSLNTPNTIVLRDGSGNFNAGTIIASLQGSASNNVLKAGDTMTGALQLPAGTTAAPSLIFTGSTTTGLSASAGDLSFSTSGLERMEITSGGTVSIIGGSFTTAGVVHNNSSGNLSSSLIVNTDIDSAAAIADTKLATISTAGKVANSATSATSANNPSTIVLRDASGNFSAGTITASLNGNATTATNFSGSLAGDVTGTQSATVVSLVGGQIASNVAAATVLANAATNANTANAIVRRDASGSFSASTITANLTGSASNNVLKAGDTMTGTLAFATQNQIDFQDAAGGQFVGLNAPATVPTSYTISLPATIPTAHQVMRANSTTPTNLEWFTSGGAVLPANSETIYVAKYGNDVTGDGSFNDPYASLSKAIDTANSLATLSNPIVILIGAGIYVEDNSAGPLQVTAQGVSIIGASSTGVSIIPTTFSNDLLLINETILIKDMTLVNVFGVSTAAGISFADGQLSNISALRIIGFQSGIMLAGAVGNSYVLENCLFVSNGTALVLNNASVECNNCTFIGADSVTGLPANTAINATGAGSSVVINGGACILCATGFNINNSAVLTAGSIGFKLNIFDVVLSAAAHMTLSGCSFDFTAGPGDIDVQISGAGTVAQIVGCEFDGRDVLGNPEATGILVSDNAFVQISGGNMSNYTTGIIVGLPSDTSSTKLSASSFFISNCTIDIQQQGSATLNFNAGTATAPQIIINDSTNVSMAFFDLGDNNALTIGSGSNENTSLLQAYIDPINHPNIEYLSSLYSTQAVGFENLFGNPSTLYVEADANAGLAAITTLRTDVAGMRLVSDTGSPVGGTSALRGWDINKNGSSAELSFRYQNSDAVGQTVIPQYTVMQLDGVNNQVQLPTINTQIVFASDTNLYRSSANVLKTDDNFIVGTLTPARAVITDGINQLASSVVTSTELSFLSGVTSSVQTQLNNKVSRSGDTMTGTLQLPAGTTALPSLVFTGSTTTGLSASAGALSLSTSGLERMKITAGGTISVDAFTSAGVVHNDASGNLSTSLIVDADVSASAGIVDTKLATISTAGKVANSATTATSANTASAIVARDASGNFSTNMITIAGTTTNPTDVATKLYVDNSVGATGTNLNTPNSLVKRDNTGSFAAQTISLVDEVASGSITVTPFNTAGVVHNNASGVLSSSLIVNADVSASAAIVDTKLATISTAGKVANSATTATSANTASTIVARDGSGNFSTNMITIAGTTTNPTDVATKSYVDNSVGATGTNLNTPNTLVRRDSTGSFAAQTISVVDEVASGNVTIIPFSTAGVVHNNASGVLSSSLIVNADVSASAAIVDTKLATISTAGKVANSATTATSANTASAIVARDASGNFSASTITANLSGNATTATNFSGSLSGDVTGTQGATVVSLVGGQTASNVAAATVLANAATNLNTANAIVRRDASGNFSAGTITASLNGNATTATTATNFSGSLAGDVTGTQGATVVSLVGGQTAANVAAATVLANAATNLNTANTIVKRDNTGSFAAQTISLVDEVATGNISLNDSTSSSVGNIVKSGTAFIHNFGTNNTFVGKGAGNFTSSGTGDNTGIGVNALSSTTTSTTNTAIGFGAMSSTTTGSDNVGIGANALSANTTGANNTAVGSGALTVNSTGLNNVAIGTSALLLNTASLNTAIGAFALDANTTGANNIAIGANALGANTIGTTNVAIGNSALGSNTTGIGNTAVGSSVLTANTIGTGLTAVGNSALAANTTGINNTAVGKNALNSVQTGTNNTAVGQGALALNTVDANTAIGNNALAANTVGTGMTAVGSSALAANTTGIHNTAVGSSALVTNTTGTGLVGVGFNALSANTIGGENTAVGNNALAANTTGNFSTAVGSVALSSNVTGSNNTAVGINALRLNTESSNTAVGAFALDANTTGTSVTAVGSRALIVNTTGSNNTAVGSSALSANTIGQSNTAMGANALAANTTGINNTAVGASAVDVNTIGTGLTGIGSNALGANTTGINNTAVGLNALLSNTVGSSTTAVGANALLNNTTANGNTAVGSNALQLNTTGSGVTAVGNNALAANTIGINNTAVGSSALAANTTGTTNVAFGSQSLAVNTIGSSNTAVGVSSLAANTTGVNNTGLGAGALSANSVGINNTAVGISALTANTTGNFSTAVGESALAANTTGINNTAVGRNALSSVQTGTSNTAIGVSALALNTVSSNTAVGSSALAANTTGTAVTAVGSGALAANTTGINNTAIGTSALNLNAVGTNNTAIGTNALAANTVSANTAVGNSALAANTIGTAVTAVGSNALAANTTGINNTAVGASALAANTVGTGLTALGSSALAANTTGIDNTAVGRSAGSGITTGSNNVIIGAGVGTALSIGANNIYIDGNALNPGNESNAIRIGNTQTTCFIKGIRGATATGGIAVLVSATGQLGTTMSSRRFKHNIQHITTESCDIFNLNPVSFAYNADETETTQYGLIAEEVEEIFPSLVARDEEGLPYTVRYEMLPVLLLSELKKQHIIIKKLEALEPIVADLQRAIVELQQQQLKMTAAA